MVKHFLIRTSVFIFYVQHLSNHVTVFLPASCFQNKVAFDIAGKDGTRSMFYKHLLGGRRKSKRPPY